MEESGISTLLNTNLENDNSKNATNNLRAVDKSGNQYRQQQGDAVINELKNKLEQVARHNAAAASTAIGSTAESPSSADVHRLPKFDENKDDVKETPSLLVFKYSQDDTDAELEARTLEYGPPSVSAFFNDDDDNRITEEDSRAEMSDTAVNPASATETAHSSSNAEAVDDGHKAPSVTDLSVKTATPSNDHQPSNIHDSFVLQEVMLRAPSSDQFILRCLVTSANESEPSSKDFAADEHGGSTKLPNENLNAVSMPVSAENVIAALYVNDDARRDFATESSTAPQVQLSTNTQTAADDKRLFEEALQSVNRIFQQHEPFQHLNSGCEAYFDDDFDSGADALDDTKQTGASSDDFVENQGNAFMLQLPKDVFVDQESVDGKDFVSGANVTPATARQPLQQFSLTDLTPVQTASVFAAIASRASLKRSPTDNHHHHDDEVTFRALVCYFNHDPFRALHYMIANCFLAGTSQYICEHFLLPNCDTMSCTRSSSWRTGSLSRLSRVRVGELLCDVNSAASHTLLKHWLKMQNFTGLSVEAALRTLLRTFSMPPDTSVMANLCHMFARRYTEYQTSEPQLTNDGVFEQRVKVNQVLSFAVVLLNADLHKIHLQEPATAAEIESNLTTANVKKKKRKKVKKLRPMSFESFCANLEQTLLTAQYDSDDAHRKLNCPLTTRQLENLYDSVRLSPLTSELDYTKTLADLHEMFYAVKSSRKCLPTNFVQNSHRFLVAWYHGVVVFEPNKKVRKNSNKSTRRRRSTEQPQDRRSSSYYYQHQRGSIIRELLLRLVSPFSSRRLQSSTKSPTSLATSENDNFSACKLKNRVLVLLNDMLLIARETRMQCWKRKFLNSGAQSITRHGAPRGLRLCRVIPFQETSCVRCLTAPGDDAARKLVVFNSAAETDDLSINPSSSVACRFTHSSSVLLQEICEQIRHAIDVNAEFMRLRPLLDKSPALSELPMLPDKAFMPAELNIL